MSTQRRGGESILHGLLLALVRRNAVGCDGERATVAEEPAEPLQALLQRRQRAATLHAVVVADHLGEVLEGHALDVGHRQHAEGVLGLAAGEQLPVVPEQCRKGLKRGETPANQLGLL